jgi:hypothetical protein
MAYNFIHRILHAEIPPPASCWDKIAGELDKSDPKNFVDKISTASVDPPASVWNRISQSLGATPSKRPLVMLWMKWSAAAVVAGGLVIAASWYLTSQKKDNAVAASANKSSSTNSASNQEITNQAAGILSEKNSRVVVAQNDVTAVNNGAKIRHQGVITPVRHATIETPAQDNNVTQVKESQPNISDNVSPDAAKYIPAPDYYLVTAPNGERVKISSKFSDAVVSLMGGDNVDYLWKSKFDNWKAKLISNPSFIPAAGNFLDIAELQDLLKEQ